MTQKLISIADLYRDSGYADFDQEHRQGGTFRVQMVMAEHGPHAFTDPPLSQMLMVGLVEGSGFAKLDFGDGWRTFDALETGVVDLQPAHQECRFEVARPHKILVAGVQADVVKRCLHDVGVQGDPFEPLYARMRGRNGQLALLHSMWRAMGRGGPANNLYVDGCVISLLGMFCAAAKMAATWSPPVIEDIRLDRVVEYIEAHFAAPIVMDDLAKVAGMSTIQFSRSFKKAVGLTPHAFLTDRRLAEAKFLLKSSQLSITEVALAAGFGSSAHFASVFSRKVGATPSAYRASTA